MQCIPTIYDRIEDVPEEDWSQLMTDPAELAMDRRLLTAFQSTMSAQCRCWFVIFRNEVNAPVASACLCRFDVDALETTGPTNQTITRQIRKLLPSYMRFGVMFCGLPVPSGASHLRWLPSVDPEALLASLDAVLQSLARKHRARLIVVKELNDQQAGALSALSTLRYLRGDIPANYMFTRRFADFNGYLAALRARYRKQIVDSQSRFLPAGGTVEVISGAGIADVFTDEVHSLYLAVRDRAEYRMETLPAEFFRDAGRRFGDAASLILLRLGLKIVGFAFGITAGGEYHNLYIGLDYARNAEADVYFNLHFHDMDRAFRSGCTRIHMGQTADAFKTRMGFEGEALSFYVRAVNPFIHGGLKRVARWVFPPVQRHETHAVFRTEPPVKNRSPQRERKGSTAGQHQ